jgi:signal transduction histidine kinase
LLTISDNGRGFDVKSVKKKRGLGLKSMRERVRLVRGTISYDSRKGHGANVNVSVKI